MGIFFRILLYIFVCFSFTQITFANVTSGAGDSLITDENPTSDDSLNEPLPDETAAQDDSYAQEEDRTPAANTTGRPCYTYGLEKDCTDADIARAGGENAYNNSGSSLTQQQQGQPICLKTEVLECGSDETGTQCRCIPAPEPSETSNEEVQGSTANNESTESEKSLDAKMEKCSKAAHQTQACCMEGFVGCLSPDAQMIAQSIQTLTAQVQQYKTNNSVARSCSSTKDAAIASKAILAAGVAMCGKETFKCNSACRPSFDCSNTGTTTASEDLFDKCKNIKKQMNSARIACGATATANAGASYINNELLSQIQQDNSTCGEQITANGDCSHLDDDTALSTFGCNLLDLCKKEEHIGKVQCRPYVNIEANDEDILASFDGSSSLDTTPTAPGADGDVSLDCDPDQEDCTFEGPEFAPLAQADEGEGTSGGSAGNSGSPVSAGGIGGSGGAGGAGGRGGAGGGKDRNILKGTSSGNGYISRFKGSGGGGGGYKNSVRRGGKSGGSAGRSISSFNLKKFLPKSKRVKKGSFKNYHRLPSGELMAPQSVDIFSLHHRAYKNACLKNKAIKGCEPHLRKNLGSNQKVSQMSSSYRSQLFLAKELTTQKANQTNIKIKNIKNDINKNARITYYQMQYMKNNKIKSLPFNSALNNKNSLNPKLASKEAQAILKMQKWVNAKVQVSPTKNNLPNTTGQSLRLPANKGK